jgi:hypothetical protein
MSQQVYKLFTIGSYHQRTIRVHAVIFNLPDIRTLYSNPDRSLHFVIANGVQNKPSDHLSVAGLTAAVASA